MWTIINIIVVVCILGVVLIYLDGINHDKKKK